MRNDENGLYHPTEDDPLTHWSGQHIMNCKECQPDFPKTYLTLQELTDGR